jgi:bifunctional non-homologous end joining protein LigD
LKEALKKELEDKPPLLKAEPHIASLLNKVNRPDAKHFLEEAHLCLRANAPRAAIVMTWIVVIDHIYEYVLTHKLSDFNLELAKKNWKITSVTTKDDFSEIKKEKDFIELCRAANVFSNDVRKILDEKLGIRNTAGHPSTVTVHGTKAANFIEDLVENVILKLDGYRALAINSKGKLSLVSRKRKSFNRQYPYILEALTDLPKNTVVDGEIVALDDAGRPNFNLLQHSRGQASRIFYFVFDVLVYENRDLTRLAFIQRREIMNSVLKFTSPRIRMAQHFETSAEEMRRAARDQGLEGVVAKRTDSRYEAGKRSGSWAKYRLNRGQELVIGGYVPGKHGLDSIIVGYYKANDLTYIARVRNGFVPASRRQAFEKLSRLTVPTCPFVNLPETHKGRWGDGLTVTDMKKCVWVRPQLVAQIEFLEWTTSDHLRHSKFVGLREDKEPQSVSLSSR